MKKVTKIFGVVTSLAMCLSMFAMTACNPADNDDGEHEHTYAATYSSNDTKHWRESDCEHKGLKTDEAKHDKNGANGSCSVCGYAPHVHAYSETYTYDRYEHWRAATCEHSILNVDKGAHDADGEDGACTVCGYKPEHTHEFRADYYTVNATQHWRAAICAHYELKEEVGDHDTDGENGTCSVCKYKPHEDSYKYERSMSHHWQRIECSLKKDGFKVCDKGFNEVAPKYKNIDEHTFDENRVCTVCGFDSTYRNYNSECIICEDCGGCIKTEGQCVHETDEGHKYCGEEEHTKKTEIEAEHGVVTDTNPAENPSIVDYSNGNRACVHLSYQNVKFVINVNKACTATLKIRNGNNGNFNDLGSCFVNDVKFDTKAYCGQPDNKWDAKCSFAWNTLGCIQLNEGENTIEIFQLSGDAKMHIDKIAIFTAEDVEITYTPVDNTKYTKLDSRNPMYSDEDKNLPEAQLKSKKVPA